MQYLHLSCLLRIPDHMMVRVVRMVVVIPIAATVWWWRWWWSNQGILVAVVWRWWWRRMRRG